jgi:hypothetical protein
MSRQLAVLFSVLWLLGSTACNFPLPARIEAAVPTAAIDTSAAVPTPTSGPDATAMPSLAPSPTLVASPTFAATSFLEPAGCERPPDDYTRLVVNGSKLNARTVWMLRRAKTLYKGTIDFAGWAITQGSYNPGGVAASFGTHDAGGAVDLSVLNRRNGRVLRDELPDAIRALRIVGFAAWVREPGELYAGSPIHIHAIAIGDAELSPIAAEQLTGVFGYFRGYNGLPKKDNIPVADRHGGPILCQWMIDMGYRDLRGLG